MKKVYSFLIIVGFIFLCLVGCTNEKEALTKCTLTQTDEAETYKLNATYNIYSKGSLVDRVVTKEIVTSNTKSVLEYFETYAVSTYKKMNKAYSGYTYTTNMTDNQITIDTTIDYTKMDLKKFANDNEGMDQFIEDDRMKLEGVIAIYEQMGATCEK